MVFKKDLIKKYKIHTSRKDIKNRKYVKTIKMYKILTLIHLNYKFKKSTFKNIQNHGLTDCLANGVQILDGMKLFKITNLKRLRLKILRFKDCLIAWLSEGSEGF